MLYRISYILNKDRLRRSGIVLAFFVSVLLRTEQDFKATTVMAFDLKVTLHVYITDLYVSKHCIMRIRRVGHITI